MPNELYFVDKLPVKKPLSVDDIVEINPQDPWITKSEGNLCVLFASNYLDMINYLDCDQSELSSLIEDINGFRAYFIDGLQKDSRGGMEFHRVRKEILFVMQGSVHLECEDVYRNKKEFALESKKGIFIPPFILHSYDILKDDTNLLVFANTLYNSNVPQTQDTYSKEVFKTLQERLRKQRL